MAAAYSKPQSFEVDRTVDFVAIDIAKGAVDVVVDVVMLAVVAVVAAAAVVGSQELLELEKVKRLDLKYLVCWNLAPVSVCGIA